MLVALVNICLPAFAEDLLVFRADGEHQAAAKRRMLICCGLPGDDRHREQMTEACHRLIKSSRTVLGVSPENLTVLAGDQEMQAALQADCDQTSVCTRETIEESLALAAQTLAADDGYWLFMIGHSHPYGAESQFNLSGKDINQSEFAKWADAIHCREQVFWLTQPISGFWIKPLARPGRVIITATEADLEFTGTEMPYALASVLSGDAEGQGLDDVDGDGVVSLLDLYLATNLEITARFHAIDRLQTEHAQLDDNGDGRGSELQALYLPAEPAEEEEQAEKEDDAEDDAAEQDDNGADQQTAAVDAPPAKSPDLTKPPLIQSVNLDGFRSRLISLKTRK
jgi:hypothetical protein